MQPNAEWLSECQRHWTRLLSFPRVLDAAAGTRVGSSPCEIVQAERTHRLLRYRRDTPATHAEPVLLCYALVNRSYILDLQPERSVVERYLKAGFDVYLIDWTPPDHEDRSLTLSDYVSRFLASSVEATLRERRRKALHLVGYCMGGTMSAMYAALYPARVKSLTLLAAPIDFACKDVLLNLWAARRHFDVDAFVDAHGNCPAWFLQMCFLNLKPVQSFFEKGIGFYEQMDDARFLSSFFAMEHWINDNVPVAGEVFREFVKNFYQDNNLVRGESRLGGRRVDLRRIASPLLLLTAKNDHLVAPSSTEGIRPHVGTSDVESMTIDAGHVGLVVSGRAHRTLWPAATQWAADRSTPASS